MKIRVWLTDSYMVSKAKKLKTLLDEKTACS